MAVTVKDVEHIASLARLTVAAEDKDRLAHELNTILKYMEKLNELDTSNVEPFSHFTAAAPVAAGRADSVTPSLPREEVLKNAPDATEKFFRVPKVLGTNNE